MAFSLKNVVPWGRSFEEYLAMFALSGEDLKGRILGVGDGPASFNAVLTRRGGRIVSVDPLYACRVSQIEKRIDETYIEVLEQTRRNRKQFVWNTIVSVEELGRMRMAAMQAFLADFESGQREGRYRAVGLPCLPFGEEEFDLALCSHLLFLYSDHLSAAFHLRSIREMCRVAREARIFPLLELGARRSRHLGPVLSKLEAEGYQVTVEEVAYEFQKGGHEMLKVSMPARLA